MRKDVDVAIQPQSVGKRDSLGLRVHRQGNGPQRHTLGSASGDLHRPGPRVDLHERRIGGTDGVDEHSLRPTPSRNDQRAVRCVDQPHRSFGTRCCHIITVQAEAGKWILRFSTHLRLIVWTSFQLRYRSNGLRCFCIYCCVLCSASCAENADQHHEAGRPVHAQHPSIKAPAPASRIRGRIRVPRERREWRPVASPLRLRGSGYLKQHAPSQSRTPTATPSLTPRH